MLDRDDLVKDVVKLTLSSLADNDEANNITSELVYAHANTILGCRITKDEVKDALKKKIATFLRKIDWKEIANEIERNVDEKFVFALDSVLFVNRISCPQGIENTNWLDYSFEQLVEVKKFLESYDFEDAYYAR